jgi:hypothetical protein
VWPWARHDAAECFIACEQRIQRLQLCQSARSQGLALVLENKAPKPFPKRARLGSYRIQLPRQRAGVHSGQNLVRHQLRLRQPSEQLFAATNPFDYFTGRGRDRVQEIEPRCVRNENCRQAIGCLAGDGLELKTATASLSLQLRPTAAIAGSRARRSRPGHLRISSLTTFRIKERLPQAHLLALLARAAVG